MEPACTLPINDLNEDNLKRIIRTWILAGIQIRISIVFYNSCLPHSAQMGQFNIREGICINTKRIRSYTVNESKNIYDMWKKVKTSYESDIAQKTTIVNNYY